MIISRIDIEKFRAFENVSFNIGRNLTAIVGRNASMKTTLLGMLSQPFTLGKECGMAGEKTLDGYDYRSQLSEKFKLSKEHDLPGDHMWKLFFNNSDIYNGKDFIRIKSVARTSKGEYVGIRFINADSGKTKGHGYVQIPVIYLSLSRLFPIGESGKTKEIPLHLSADEESNYINWYSEILSIQNLHNPSVSLEKKDSKRVFSGVSNDTNGIDASSAGEGNVGRILISLLSFMRLKEKYGKKYRGGILLIDEIDSTLHGYSQRKIIEFLNRKSTELKIQIIFTTHSPTILKTVSLLQRDELKRKRITDTAKYVFDNQIIYLTPSYNDQGTRFIVGENVTSTSRLRVVINDMELKSTYLNQHVHLYTEDKRSISLIRRVFAYKKIDIDKYVDHIDVNLGWPNDCQLINKGVPEFLENMIVLDKDVSTMKHNPEQKNAISRNNVVYMPVDIEKGLFQFLKNHSNFNGFRKVLNSYKCEMSYDICFSDWPGSDYIPEEYKAWFMHLEKSIPNLDYLFDFWCSANDDLVECFINSFMEGYNSIAEEKGIEYMII